MCIVPVMLRDRAEMSSNTCDDRTNIEDIICARSWDHLESLGGG